MLANRKIAYIAGRVYLFKPGRNVLGFERRNLEVFLSLADYPELEYDQDFSVVYFKRFPLPSIFNKSHTQLLIELPTEENNKNPYPLSPPDSFYFDYDLKTDDRDCINYTKGYQNLNWVAYNDKLQYGLGRFPFKPVKWNPCLWDPIQGSNLMTIIQEISFSLNLFRRRGHE